MSNYTHRIIKKIKFFKKNKKLCKKAFKDKNALYRRKLWKTPEGRKLLNKAMKHIGYAKNTSKADIFITLQNNYYKLKADKII